MKKEAMKGIRTIRWTATQARQAAAAPQGAIGMANPR